jgi:hypothetical protein
MMGDGGHVRLLAVAFGLLAGLMACEPGSTTYKPDTTGLGTPFDSGTSDILTNAMGTQVGSEGFWGCPIEDVRPILNGADTIDELGGSPSSLTGERMGSWSLSIEDEGGSGAVPGTLTLIDQGTYLWLDVAEGPGCSDHLASPVTGALVRDGAPAQPMLGVLAISALGTRLVITDEGDLSSTTSIWGTPSYADLTGVTFRLDGEADASTLGAEAAYVDCPELEVECPTADVKATVDGTR